MATSPVANEGVNEIPWEAATPYEVPCLSPVASSEPFYAELTPTMPSYNFVCQNHYIYYTVMTVVHLCPILGARRSRVGDIRPNSGELSLVELYS